MLHFEQIFNLKSVFEIPLSRFSKISVYFFVTRISLRNFAVFKKHELMTYSKSENKEKIMQRYVDLLKNSGFKAVFGDRNNKRGGKVGDQCSAANSSESGAY